MEAVVLLDFAAFADARGDTHVRAQTVLEWAARPRSTHARLRRLSAAVVFARHLKGTDPRHEVPPSGVFGRRPQGRAYVFSPEQVRDIISVAAALGPPGSIRPRTYSTLFGLLASTGLRIGEALALQVGDVTRDGLLIRNTKFRKSRLVPLHPTAVDALAAYLRVRSEVALADPHVFVTIRGTRLAYPTAAVNFLRRRGARPDNPSGRLAPHRGRLAFRGRGRPRDHREQGQRVHALRLQGTRVREAGQAQASTDAHVETAVAPTLLSPREGSREPKSRVTSSKCATPTEALKLLNSSLPLELLDSACAGVQAETYQEHVPIDMVRGDPPMLKVWSDGLDVVVARELCQVPSVLDRHYRVTGHTLRHAAWREVPQSLTVALQHRGQVEHVPAADLTRRPRACWIGRLADVSGHRQL